MLRPFSPSRHPPFLILMWITAAHPFTVLLSPFSLLRSPFPVPRSPFPVPRSPFPVLRFSFSVLHFSFLVSVTSLVWRLKFSENSFEVCRLTLSESEK